MLVTVHAQELFKKHMPEQKERGQYMVVSETQRRFVT
jgi:hypothetical protein